jgi:hypothetical protein
MEIVFVMTVLKIFQYVMVTFQTDGMETFLTDGVGTFQIDGMEISQGVGMEIFQTDGLETSQDVGMEIFQTDELETFVWERLNSELLLLPPPLLFEPEIYVSFSLAA